MHTQTTKSQESVKKTYKLWERKEERGKRDKKKNFQRNANTWREYSRTFNYLSHIYRRKIKETQKNRSGLKHRNEFKIRNKSSIIKWKKPETSKHPSQQNKMKPPKAIHIQIRKQKRENLGICDEKPNTNANEGGGEGELACLPYRRWKRRTVSSTVQVFRWFRTISYIGALGRALEIE